MITAIKNILTLEEQSESVSIQDASTEDKHAAELKKQTLEMRSQLSNFTTSHSRKICYAYKCRILRAKGILCKPMPCANNRNMCSVCLNETLRHRKVLQLEKDTLESNTSNQILAPIRNRVSTLITLKHARKLLQHLLSATCNKRDDHIYRAMQYMSNTLGILLEDTNTGDNIDQPMSIRQAWRMALFKCRWDNKVMYHQKFGERTFCKTCSFLVFQNQVVHVTTCPCCNINESWEIIRYPCLACQCAALVYWNPFHLRYKHQLVLWLSPVDTDGSEPTLSEPTR